MQHKNEVKLLIYMSFTSHLCPSDKYVAWTKPSISRLSWLFLKKKQPDRYTIKEHYNFRTTHTHTLLWCPWISRRLMKTWCMSVHCMLSARNKPPQWIIRFIRPQQNCLNNGNPSVIPQWPLYLLDNSSSSNINAFPLVLIRNSDTVSCCREDPTPSGGFRPELFFLLR